MLKCFLRYKGFGKKTQMIIFKFTSFFFHSLDRSFFLFSLFSQNWVHWLNSSQCILLCYTTTVLNWRNKSLFFKSDLKNDCCLKFDFIHRHKFIDVYAFTLPYTRLVYPKRSFWKSFGENYYCLGDIYFRNLFHHQR